MKTFFSKSTPFHPVVCLFTLIIMYGFVFSVGAVLYSEGIVGTLMYVEETIIEVVENDFDYLDFLPAGLAYMVVIFIMILLLPIQALLAFGFTVVFFGWIPLLLYFMLTIIQPDFLTKSMRVWRFEFTVRQHIFALIYLIVCIIYLSLNPFII